MLQRQTLLNVQLLADHMRAPLVKLSTCLVSHTSLPPLVPVTPGPALKLQCHPDIVTHFTHYQGNVSPLASDVPSTMSISCDPRSSARLTTSCLSPGPHTLS